MVVKPLSESHNHVRPRLCAGQTWLCHSNSVIWGASELQLRRAHFASTSVGSCNFLAKPPEILWAVPGQVRLSCPHLWPTPCGAGHFLRVTPLRGSLSVPLSYASERTICYGPLGP